MDQLFSFLYICHARIPWDNCISLNIILFVNPFQDNIVMYETPYGIAFFKYSFYPVCLF